MNGSRLRGFTLIELLVVMAIIAMLAATAPHCLTSWGLVRSKLGSVAELSMIESALDSIGWTWANTRETSKILMRTGSESAGRPYLKKGIPLDPWGNARPTTGKHNRRGYDLYSFGADGRWGTITGQGCGQLVIRPTLCCRRLAGWERFYPAPAAGRRCTDFTARPRCPSRFSNESTREFNKAVDSALLTLRRARLEAVMERRSNNVTFPRSASENDCGTAGFMRIEVEISGNNVDQRPQCPGKIFPDGSSSGGALDFKGSKLLTRRIPDPAGIRANRHRTRAIVQRTDSWP